MLSLFFMFSDWITTLGVVVLVITDTLEESFSAFTCKTFSSFGFDAFLVFDLRFESVIIKIGKPKNTLKLGIFSGKTR